MKKKINLDFHHLGLATSNLNSTLKILKSLGYNVDSIKINKAFNVRNAICKSSKMPKIEVISKIKGSKSPIDNLLKKQSNSIYHICYMSNNLNDTLKSFKKNKIDYTRVSNPEFSPFEGVYSSFFYISGIGLVEIMDRSSKK